MAEKTGKQVEVFYFYEQYGQMYVLLLKRSEQKGGFWQPLTGGNEQGETLIDTVYREGFEETGLMQNDILRLIDTGFSFTFEDHGRTWHETMYGAEVAPEAAITLSDEHTEYRWGSQSEALDLLKWPDNKEGLRRLANYLRSDFKGA